jgi:hypothetical protein
VNILLYRGLWDSLRNMIQVSDTGSFEPFVVIVKIEARLGEGLL